MRRLTANKGFTLMEAIVSIAIAGIIIVPLAMIFYRSLTSVGESRNLLRATQLAQSYVEYTKGVTISKDNGFEIPLTLSEEDMDEVDFYYEKILPLVDGKYNVSIQVFPNVYKLGGNNSIEKVDGFMPIYENADGILLPPIPVLGDIVENRRKVKISYEDVEIEGDATLRTRITYEVENQSVDGTINKNYKIEQVIENSKLSGNFILFYTGTNFDPTSMEDQVEVYNKSALNLTVYVLKTNNVKEYPQVEVKEGIVSVTKDTVIDDLNDKRIYKVVVTVESDGLDDPIILEATKNER